MTAPIASPSQSHRIADTAPPSESHLTGKMLLENHTGQSTCFGPGRERLGIRTFLLRDAKVNEHGEPGLLNLAPPPEDTTFTAKTQRPATIFQRRKQNAHRDRLPHGEVA